MAGASPQSSQVKSFCENICYFLSKVIWWGEEMAGASPLASSKRNVPPWSAGLATRSVVGFVDAKVVFFIISTKFFERKSISGRCFCKNIGYSLPKVISLRMVLMFRV